MISLSGVSISQGAFSLEGIDLTIPMGKYGILMGRTGSGKSTLVEIICGLRTPSAGMVTINDRDVTGVNPALRGIGYVPQDEALFAGLTVRENLSFALDIRKVDKQTVSQRVDEMAKQLRIGHLLERGVSQLSGGEQQRVALGRALIFQPAVLLLDEPLGALDEDTRQALIPLLKSVTQAHQVTTLHITHDQHEADALGDLQYQLGDSRVALVS